MTPPKDFTDPTEAAIAARLAKLAAMPVDTSTLDRSLRQQLPAPPKPSHRRRWIASLSAVAASLLIMLTVAIALSGRQAEASPSLMAQMHRDIVSGAIPTMNYNSIEDANRAIAALSGNFPQLPQPPHTEVPMACCMRNIGNKKVACILLNDGQSKITMSIADASQVQSPPSSPTVTRNGVTYHVTAVDELHMVMTERQNRWICLIGPVPAEKLMDLADAIKFQMNDVSDVHNVARASRPCAIRP